MEEREKTKHVNQNWVHGKAWKLNFDNYYTSYKKNHNEFFLTYTVNYIYLLGKKRKKKNQV